VKLLGTVRQILNRRVTVFQLFYRETSAQQAASAADLARRQSALESGHSVIEAALSAARRDLFGLRSARESANQAECEVTELVAEVRSVRFASETALEALSQRTDAAEE
jgi:hypothetical protein